MTGAILIGGKSTRFGSDKIFASDGKSTLIDRVKNILNPLFEELLLIGHKREELLEAKEDIIPGKGPMGGIYTALYYSISDYCFVFAADMPNLNRPFIEYMQDKTQTGKDIIVPAWSKGIEPLHAIYHKRLMPVIMNLLENDKLKIFGLYSNADILEIPEADISRFDKPETIFSNINAPQDALLFF